MISVCSSLCHCHPYILCFIKIQNLTVFYLSSGCYPGFSGKVTIKRFVQDSEPLDFLGCLCFDVWDSKHYFVRILVLCG